LNQSKENITKLMTLYPTQYLGTALSNLRSCFSLGDNWYVWSHGSNFDTVILENAYRLIGGSPWWDYKNVRDTRTLFDVAGCTYTAKGGHDALEDARNQAEAVQKAYQQLKGRVNM
jgi:3' exoribonuclease, RNase T-like